MFFLAFKSNHYLPSRRFTAKRRQDDVERGEGEDEMCLDDDMDAPERSIEGQDGAYVAVPLMRPMSTPGRCSSATLESADEKQQDPAQAQALRGRFSSSTSTLLSISDSECPSAEQLDKGPPPPSSSVPSSASSSSSSSSSSSTSSAATTALTTPEQTDEESKKAPEPSALSIAVGLVPAEQQQHQQLQQQLQQQEPNTPSPSPLSPTRPLQSRQQSRPAAPAPAVEAKDVEPAVDALIAEARRSYFSSEEVDDLSVSTAEEAAFVRRCIKVVSHEVTHSFSIKHCTYFSCRMNGSSTMAATDASPFALCPVCLRKLHGALAFEPRRRQAALHVALEQFGPSHFEKEIEWSHAWLTAVEKEAETQRRATKKKGVVEVAGTTFARPVAPAPLTAPRDNPDDLAKTLIAAATDAAAIATSTASSATAAAAADAAAQEEIEMVADDAPKQQDHSDDAVHGEQCAEKEPMEQSSSDPAGEENPSPAQASNAGDRAGADDARNGEMCVAASVFGQDAEIAPLSDPPVIITSAPQPSPPPRAPGPPPPLGKYKQALINKLSKKNNHIGYSFHSIPFLFLS